MNEFKLSHVEAPRVSREAPPRVGGSWARRGALMAGAIVVVAAMSVVGMRLAPQAAPPVPAMGPVPVSVAVIAKRQMPVWSAFSGRLEAVGRVAIKPRAGGTIIAAHFREGSLVKAGDLLFTIDPAPYLAEVQRLDAQVAAASARVVLAARQQQRGFALVTANDLAKSDVDARVNEYSAAQAALRGAVAALETAKLNLGYTEVRAPIAGRVGKIEVTEGNLVPAGPTAPVLTTLVSVDPIYASFDADEVSVARALATLPAGHDVSTVIGEIPVELGIFATEGTALRGRLQMVDNVVDVSSGTVRVRAMFDNHDGRLMPGQFARLRLGQARTEPMIVIDERAIGTDQDRRFVMVVGPDNKIAPRQVVLGGTVEGMRVVESGLRPSERIVVDGLQRVRPGAVVAPTVLAGAGGSPNAYASR